MIVLRLFAPLAALIGLVGPALAEVCTDRGGGQYASNAQLCVSSVLAPQGTNAYGPDNLAGAPERAWCEGVNGDGQGEYIRLAFAAPVRFKSIDVGNGYNKSAGHFRSNARARTVRIETGDGTSFTAELPDRPDRYKIRLPHPVETKSVRLTIVDVYRGERYRDLCIHYFWPDFEEAARENH